MNNLVEDISTLTTIPKLNIQKLLDIAVKCLSHNIVESMKMNQDVCVEDIGIGTLTVNLNKDELKFRFTPSSQLQNSILNAMNSGESDLVINVEKVLQEKIINTYKSLL